MPAKRHEKKLDDDGEAISFGTRDYAAEGFVPGVKHKQVRSPGRARGNTNISHLIPCHHVMASCHVIIIVSPFHVTMSSHLMSSLSCHHLASSRHGAAAGPRRGRGGARDDPLGEHRVLLRQPRLVPPPSCHVIIIVPSCHVMSSLSHHHLTSSRHAALRLLGAAEGGAARPAGAAG